MNQLIKYILIAIIPLAIFEILFLNLNASWDETEPQGPIYFIGIGLLILFFFGVPIFIVLISAVYQYKNPNWKEYRKSLLIPISSIVIEFIFIMGLLEDEEGLVAGLVFTRLASIFVIVLVTNFIIFLVRKRK